MDPAPGDSRHDPAVGSAAGSAVGSTVGSAQGPRTFSWDFQVRFIVLNASGHLDNLQILRAVDEARHRLLGVGEPGAAPLLVGLLADAPAHVATLVAAHRVEYRRELWFAAAPLDITLWVCRVGGSSFDVATEVRQSPAEPIAAVAVTPVVLVDTTTRSPWPLSAPVRAALTAYLGPAPTLR